MWASAPGTHCVPCSVNTTVMPGKRSNTPDSVRCHSARFAQNAASIANISTDVGAFGSFGMPVPPAWCDSGMSRSWQICQIGSYAGENSGSIHGVSGAAPGSRTPLEAVLVCPDDVGHRVVDVVEEDLGLPGPLVGVRGAEVGEPAVVGPDAGQSPLVVLGRRCRRDHGAGGEERRHRVGEDDLADDALAVQVAESALVVPVAGPAVALEVAERVGVLAAPGVELVAPFRVEVLPVLLVVAAGVAVRRDDDVVVRALHS